MSPLSVVGEPPVDEQHFSAERHEAMLALRSGARLTVAAIVLVALSLFLNQVGPVRERMDIPATLWAMVAVAFTVELAGWVVVELRHGRILEHAPIAVLDGILWTSTFLMALGLAGGIVLIPASTTVLSVMFVMLVVYAGYFYKRTYALTAIAWCVTAYVGGSILANTSITSTTGPSLAAVVPVVGVMGLSGAFVAIVRRSRDRTEQRARITATVGLARALDLRDQYTAEHSDTVSRYAAAMARELGLEGWRVERIRLAGLLHDVGKIGIPDAVLLKPSGLTDEEWDLMRRHPEMGAQMLDSRALRDIRRWVLAHHERPDGRGYPAGLSGEAIPLEARILAVADAFEAMTANRVYRAGMPVEAAVAELNRCSGTQFDPRVVDAFVAALDRKLEANTAGIAA